MLFRWSGVYAASTVCQRSTMKWISFILFVGKDTHILCGIEHFALGREKSFFFFHDSIPPFFLRNFLGMLKNELVVVGITWKRICLWYDGISIMTVVLRVDLRGEIWRIVKRNTRNVAHHGTVIVAISQLGWMLMMVLVIFGSRHFPNTARIDQ